MMKKAKPMIKFLATAALAITTALADPDQHKSSSNAQVLVGIIAQPTEEFLRTKAFNEEEVWSYIVGSYIDWVSQTGAMPVLIPYDAEEAQMNFFMDTVDMILLPGGATPLETEFDKTDIPTDYQNIIHKIIQKVKKINKEDKRYFPLFATCQGFESLLISENGNNGNIMDCTYNDNHKNHSISLIREHFQKSTYWKSFGLERVEEVFSHADSYFTHDCGFDPKVMKTVKTLKEEYLLIGVASTFGNSTTPPRQFVAIIEHKELPIYANQWHMEKNQYERGEQYHFLDRRETATMFMGDGIRKVVQDIREKGRPKQYDDIPGMIKPFFSVYRSPEVIRLVSYERIYTFERNDRKVN